MAALATAVDVAAALGRTLTTEETNRSVPLLLLASAAVSNETGYRFAPGEYTVERRVRGRKVKLPALVDSVDDVVAVDQCDGSETALVVDVDYTVRGSTVYGLSGCWVGVTFTVEADVPAEIVALVAGIVASTIEAPSASIDSETAGPFTTSYVDSTGRVFLSKSDKLILAPYKQPRPAVVLG